MFFRSFVLVLLLATAVESHDMRISLDYVDTLVNGELPCEYPVTFYFRITNTSTHDIAGSANGFRIYSPDLAIWKPGFTVDTIPCDWGPCNGDLWYILDTSWYGEFIDSTLPNGQTWKGRDPQIYDGGIFMNTFSVDGYGADTIGFAGFNQTSGLGLYPGFDYVGWKISIASISKGSAGRTLCIDSAYFPPSGRWLWANDNIYYPAWDGPHCWTISSGEPPPPPPPPPPPGAWVHLESVEGMIDGRLPVGMPIAFRMRFTNNTEHTIEGSANGFRLYSPDGATWEPGIFVDTPVCCFPYPGPCPDTSYYGEWENSAMPNGLVWKGADPQVYDGGVFVNVYSRDGQGADTIGFAGFSQSTGIGMYPGFDAVGPRIVIQRISESSAGKTLCIDSAYFPPAGRWIWANSVQLKPYWDGPHCFEIGSCCVGKRGNVDITSDEINIADLTGLVREIFQKRELSCPLACNVDGDKAETVDIVDLVYLVDYMFRGGPEPAACP